MIQFLIPSLTTKMIRWDKKLKTMSPEERDYALNGLVENVISSRRWDRLRKLLLNIFFLESKSQAGMIFELADDLQKAKNGVTSKHESYGFYELIEEAIRRDIHFVQRYPSTLFQCLWNSCWWYDCPEAEYYYCASSEAEPSSPPWGSEGPKLFALVDKWRQAKRESGTMSPWMRSLAPPCKPLRGALADSLSGHTEAVCSLSFSPDGKYLLSASYDGTVRLWDRVSLQEIVCAEVERRSFLSVGFLKSGEPVYAAEVQNGNIRISSLKRNLELAALNAREELVECFAVSADWAYFACGYRDGTIVVWDVLNKEQIAAWDTMSFVDPSKDSPEVELLRASESLNALSATTSKVTSKKKRFDDYAQAFKQLSELGMPIANLRSMLTHGSSGHTTENYPRVLGLTGNGQLLAWASGRGTVHVYDISRKAEASRKHIQEGITALEFSRDGRHLFCGGFRGVWAIDVETSRILWCPEENDMKSITCMQSSTDEAFIACGHQDGATSIVDTKNGRVRSECKNNVFSNECIAVSPDSDCVAFASEDAKINIVRVDEMGRNSLRIRGHRDQITCVSVCSDGSRYITGSADATIRIWESDTARQLAVMKGHKDAVSRAVFVEEGNSIVSFSDDRTVRIWDSRNAKERVDPMIHKSIITCVEVSEVSSCIVSGCNDGTVHIWSMVSGDLEKSFMAHEGGVEYLSMSHDGAILASGGYDFSLKIWDMRSCSLDAIVDDKDDSCFGAPRPRFMGKSKHLACWFGDDRIVVFDLQKGCQVACFEPGQSIRHYTITDDGEFVIVECENHEIVVWSTSTHDVVRRFLGYVLTEGDVWAISQNPDCRQWRAVPDGDVTHIEHIEIQKEVAWVPRRALSILPRRHVWIGTEGAFLYSYILDDLQ